MRSVSVPSPDELETLNERLLALAETLYVDRGEGAALMLASAVIESLPGQVRREQRKWRRRRKARDHQVMRLYPPQVAQLLLLGFAAQALRGILGSSGESRNASERLRVLYLVELVKRVMRRNSMEAAVAIHSFVYDSPSGHISTLQEVLTGNALAWEAHHIDARRKKLCEDLARALPGLLRKDESPDRANRFAPDPDLETEEVERLLAALAPWDGRCDLPEVRGRLNPLMAPYIEDLHSGAAIQSPEEDAQLEINRVYAVIEPSVHERLLGLFRLHRNLHFPKLFPGRFFGSAGEEGPAE